MNSRRNCLVATLVAILSFAYMPMATADTDPFPGVAYMAEIPGTRVSGDIALNCPAGSGRGIEVGSGTFTYCVKTWRSEATLAAWATYRANLDAAQATALTQSQDWNAAHPGQQKCFQWGPFTDPDGGTSSGGVCANPVPVNSPSDTATVTLTETSTPVVETVTPIAPTPAPAPVQITNGFGGYAVVHPDGHVCGVIVANSSDPFNNGGIMPQEYMGCPSGSRFVFQTTPSESGNVAGWHGSNVTWDGSKFTIANGSSWIHITNGVATDQNGRVWDTGTGRVISAGNTPPPAPFVDSSTVRTDTSTVTINSTPSSPSNTDTATVNAPVPTLFNAVAPISSVDTTTVVAPVPADDLDSLPEVDAEEEVTNVVLGTIVSNKTRIEVSTLWANTKLNIVATKKGSKKKYTYRFTTNNLGDYTFKSSVNLKGYLLVLYKGTEELDRDFV